MFRQTYLQLYDPMAMGARTDAAGNPLQVENTNWRARIPESRQTYYYAATVDWIPRPEHHLTLAAMGTPELQRADAVVQQRRVHLEPGLGAGEADKSNSDFVAHWTSSCYDNHWRIDARAGVHTEYLYDGRPNPALNERNQLDYFGANLWDLEHAPGCAPIGTLSALPRRRLPHGRIRPHPASTTAGAGWPISSRPTCSRPAATTTWPSAGTRST